MNTEPVILSGMENYTAWSTDLSERIKEDHGEISLTISDSTAMVPNLDTLWEMRKTKGNIRCKQQGRS